MKDKLKFSIITPSFNQGRFIEETILSVLNQTYQNFEHLVFDGGSNDNTLQILEKYDHLKWVTEPDDGQTDAINKGTKTASGDIWAYINSDDTYLPDTLESVAKVFNEHPEIDVVYGRCNRIDENSEFIRNHYSLPFNFNILLNTHHLISQPACFVRLEAIKEVGYLDKSQYYIMDWDLWLRLAVAGKKFYFLNNPLANFREHANAKSETSTVKWLEDRYLLYQKYYKKTYGKTTNKATYHILRCYYTLYRKMKTIVYRTTHKSY